MKKSTVSIIALALVFAVLGSIALVAAADSFGDNGWLFGSAEEKSSEKLGLTEEEKASIRAELQSKEIAEKEAAKNNPAKADTRPLTEEEKETLRREVDNAIEEGKLLQEMAASCVSIVQKYYPGQYNPPAEKYTHSVFRKDLAICEYLLLCVKNDKLTEEEKLICASGLYTHLMRAEGEEHDRIEAAIEPWLHPEGEEEISYEEESSGYTGVQRTN